MNRYTSYFHYWFNAKKRHNIHSPFVYELSDRCLSKVVSIEHKILINKQFEVLSSNNNTIQISDFGAGSKVMGNERKIRDIFKNSRSSKRYADLLYKLCAHYKPERVLEFGTSLAWGTLHMHLGNPNAKIDTIEGCPQTYHVSKSMFPVDTEKVCFHDMTFEDFIESLSDQKYDLIFIDGNHRGSALLEYVEQLFDFSHDETIWILDDIRWSDDMWHAWNKIIEDNRFHVSIDFMRMGVILRRPTQVKEHFYLRL